jgi:SAM-dependent methyltransferase
VDCLPEAVFLQAWDTQGTSGTFYDKLTRRARSEELEIQDIEALTPRGQKIMGELHEANRQMRYYDLFSHRFGRFLERKLEGRTAFSVMEIGTGHGYVIINLAARYAKTHPEAVFWGTDISSEFVKMATQNGEAEGCENLSFFECDALELRDDFNSDIDFIVMSTFIHHLKPYELYRLLCSIAGLAKLGIFIVDVRRDFLNLLKTRFLTVFNNMYSDDFKNDAVQSMRRAYTVAELGWIINQVPRPSAFLVEPMAPVFLMVEGNFQ